MTLRVFQSLWAMQRLPCNAAAEWSLSERLDAIVAAGFDGIDIPLASSVPDGEAALRLAGDKGLDWSLLCFPSSVDEFKRIVERFADSPARQINIQPAIRPLTVAEAVPYVLGCLDAASDAGIPVYFETHRNRMTTSLRYTVQLLDEIPSMELVADLSHYLVAEAFAWPISDANHALIRRVLARARGFHGRVGSRDQVQISVSFPHHRQWVDLFAQWWEEGFRLWRQRADPDAELIFVTELGPPDWYAITDAEHRELSDRWTEATMLMEIVRETWAALEEDVTT